MRRLRFAFETPKHYFVYYELGHPWGSASAVVFSKDAHHRVKFLWGGVDSGWPDCAKTPKELGSRILRHKLQDDLPYIW
jgi:hypothetical protein